MLRTDLSRPVLRNYFRLLSENTVKLFCNSVKSLVGKSIAFIEEFGILKLMHFKANIYVWSLGHFYIC